MKQKSSFFSNPYKFSMMSLLIKPTSGHTRGYATDLSAYPQIIPHSFSLLWRCSVSWSKRYSIPQYQRPRLLLQGSRSGITIDLPSGHQVQFLQKEKSETAWQICTVPSCVTHARFHREKHGIHTQLLWPLPLESSILSSSYCIPCAPPCLHLCLSSIHTPQVSLPQHFPHSLKCSLKPLAIKVAWSPLSSTAQLSGGPGSELGIESEWQYG